MRIVNRKARRNYEILEKIEAGIVLLGFEVKSVRRKRVKLEDSFAKIVNNEVVLFNCFIAPYDFADTRDYDAYRPRKLLLHKKQIIKLKTKMSQRKGLTLVPLSLYTKGSLIKVEIALAKGRKKFEKKQVEKEKAIRKTIDKQIKEYMKSY